MKSKISFYVVVTILLLQYVGLLLQGLDGIRVNTNYMIGGALASCVCWWYIWKQLNRKPALGAILGIIAYFIVMLTSLVLSIR